ncbi:Card1-like endonuclease domain-containing protein [Thermonema rossianum]|uniref:Card1-like endonuclease domain-containing protein n=1 Tax=Thermonema rossianum TaxID=55505 RepID=UPI000571B401|nr:DUF1887 family CARF protein [Thermonema rossianum]
MEKLQNIPPGSVLVTLVSEQTIPNVMLIKQLKAKLQNYLFIYTERTRLHLQWILQATGLQTGNYRIFSMQTFPEGYSAIFNDLQTFVDEKMQLPPHTPFLVNLTGGTKIMSLAVFNYFKQHFDLSYFFYLPFGRNQVNEVYPASSVYPLSIKLSLEEYFTAYGMHIQASGASVPKELSTPEQMMQALKKAKWQLPDNKAVQENADMSEAEKKYLTGEWFELYCMLLIKKSLGLPDKAIACGIKVQNMELSPAERYAANSDNEIDIAFVYENRLYLAECKVLRGKSAATKVHNDAFYRLTTVAQRLGIACRKMVFALVDLSAQRDFVDRKARLLGIDYVADLNDFRKDMQLKSLFKKITG